MTSIKTIEKFTAPLHAMGLLTADEHAEVEALIGKAYEADAIARNHDEIRRLAVIDAAKAVVTAADITAAISKAAVKVPSDAVPLMAAAAHTAAVQAAHAVTFARKHEIPGVLSARFDAVATEALSVAADLDGVRTPADAIAFGATDAWKRLTDLHDTYSSLESLRTELRLEGIIPASSTANSGSHWSWLKPVDEDAAYRARQADDDGLSAFIYAMTRAPYCPASRDEAMAVLTAWEGAAA